MSKLKLGVFSLLAVAVVLVLVELSGAYLLHLESSRQPLASLEILQRTGQLFDSGAPTLQRRGTSVPGEKLALPINENPFISYPTHVGNYRFHPFIDYAGVHMDRDGEIVFPDLDFFGFRNDSSSIYFAEPSDDRFLVVMTGGSELAGFAQSRTIAERLEEKLRARLGDQFESVVVLNMGMNSYVLANEVNSFVHLAYALEPDIVISHSGWNDLVYGATAPPEFQRLGLNFLGPIIDWLPRLYDLEESNKFAWRIEPIGLDDVVPAFVRNLSKYRAIAETSGARFVLGLQGFDLSQNSRYHPTIQEIHELVGELFGDVRLALPADIDLVDFTQVSGLEFHDPVHTRDSAAERIAQIYADHILGSVR